ncbi:hypothetical protein [Rhodohalobacter mucosus]|uniref:Uncharacterized protein n=1 Tax=Rhodohalobacter mucosus TaxID=2079485 RepID=A0A316TTR7_9BACT|nr:hypothetical protein [Rhodohalobacter mucosus]PWN07830.1 hypothetical protein DDZ15_02125 [Rhodohalobacter mucosus]
MLSRGKLILLFLSFSLLAFAACDVTSEKALDESLEPVPKVSAIKGADNASIRVNNGTTSNFSVDIQNVEWNTLISNGEREAYCIAWKDPISRNNAIYEGVGVYSTDGDEQFANINRLFSMKNELMKNDPELTWREIQVAVWILVPFQDFDMNMPASELPEEVRSNGQPNFNKEKVQDIVDAVLSRSAAKTTSFSGMASSTTDDDYEKTMCVIGTNEDTQTLIVPCDETAFAYGGTKEADFNGLAGDTEDGVSLDPYAHCFPDDEEIEDTRWGWTNGALGEGTYTFPLYAGAGKCNLSKGQYSGDVEIVYEGSTVKVTFTAAPGVTFYQEDGESETHLYVGNVKMPASGAAPGKYPNNDDVVSSSDTEVVYEVTGVSGDIYVVAHAVMAGYEVPEVE